MTLTVTTYTCKFATIPYNEDASVLAVEKRAQNYFVEGAYRPLKYCRGIRGATTVEHNTREEILAATRELLELLTEHNDLQAEDIVSVIFTVTADLDAAFPAIAARDLGWTETALLCAREIPVPNSLGNCIRVLLHVNTERSAAEIQHVYIREAVSLRPTFRRDS